MVFGYLRFRVGYARGKDVGSCQPGPNSKVTSRQLPGVTRENP